MMFIGTREERSRVASSKSLNRSFAEIVVRLGGFFPSVGSPSVRR
jgi:hypothetical protein